MADYDDDEEREELLESLTNYQIEVDDLNAQIDSLEFERDDWHRTADSRSREIIRLMDENEKFRERTKQYCAGVSGDYNELLTAVKALDDQIRAKYGVSSDEMYTCPLMRKLHQLIVKHTCINTVNGRLTGDN